MIYEKALAYFKQTHEKARHTGVVLVGDETAQRVLSAFSTMPVSYQPDDTHAPVLDMEQAMTTELERLLWDWVWDQVRVDMAQLAERSGATLDVTSAKFEVLRAARLVFPDGTIAEVGASLLRATLARELRKGMPKISEVPS